MQHEQVPELAQAQLLAELARELQGATNESDTAQSVTDRAAALIPDADWVSLTIRARRRRWLTLATTDPRARQADELQYSLREGPCVDASEGVEWYRSGDVGHDGRWPTWGPQARGIGVGSLLSIRLLARDGPIGALNLYAPGTGCFVDPDEVDFAVMYAAHVSVALTSAREVSGLQNAVHSRHLIGVAQGILMERHELDLEQSFNLLRRYSSVLNTKLAVLAQEIITCGELPASPPDDRSRGST